MEHGAVKVAMVMKLKESCVGDTATRKLECGGLWAEIVAQEVIYDHEFYGQDGMEEEDIANDLAVRFP